MYYFCNFAPFICVLTLQLMGDNIEIIKNTDEFLHIKSETVPDWVSKLTSLKDKIIEKLDSSKSNESTSNLQSNQDK